MTSNITFRSLAYTDIVTLLTCFNQSFKEYYVPLQLTKEQLADKLYAEAIDMKLSFGAFDNGKLVAFILNAIDLIDTKTVAYNAGTGVLPEYRGKQLSFSLYEYCLHQLKNIKIENAILEVIDKNVPAIKTYERIGFAKTRTLISYKGKPEINRSISAEIKTINYPDWKRVEEMCEWERSWQYNNNTLQRGWNNYSMLIAYQKEIAEAYCIVNFKNGRVANFGTQQKDSEHLFSLFNYLKEKIENPLVIINIDEKAAYANSFITSIGLEQFITQYEMRMDL